MWCKTACWERLQDGLTCRICFLSFPQPRWNPTKQIIKRKEKKKKWRGGKKEMKKRSGAVGEKPVDTFFLYTIKTSWQIKQGRSYLSFFHFIYFFFLLLLGVALEWIFEKEQFCKHDTPPPKLPA